jgi:hypothetical protein
MMVSGAKDQTYEGNDGIMNVSERCTVLGNGWMIVCDWATVIGDNNKVFGHGALVVGRNNTVHSGHAVCVGSGQWTCIDANGDRKTIHSSNPNVSVSLRADGTTVSTMYDPSHLPKLSKHMAAWGARQRISTKADYYNPQGPMNPYPFPDWIRTAEILIQKGVELEEARAEQSRARARLEELALVPPAVPPALWLYAIRRHQPLTGPAFPIEDFIRQLIDVHKRDGPLPFPPELSDQFLANEHREAASASALAHANFRRIAAETSSATADDNNDDDDDDAGSGSDMCTVCMTKPISIVFIPCGHICTCPACANRPALVHCPVCRARIDQRVKTFRAGTT